MAVQPFTIDTSRATEISLAELSDAQLADAFGRFDQDRLFRELKRRRLAKTEGRSSWAVRDSFVGNYGHGAAR